jgi:hypothetical protein
VSKILKAPGKETLLPASTCSHHALFCNFPPYLLINSNYIHISYHGFFHVRHKESGNLLTRDYAIAVIKVIW